MIHTTMTMYQAPRTARARAEQWWGLNRTGQVERVLQALIHPDGLIRVQLGELAEWTGLTFGQVKYARNQLMKAGTLEYLADRLYRFRS
jgi:hypothetical protein